MQIWLSRLSPFALRKAALSRSERRHQGEPIHYRLAVPIGRRGAEQVFLALAAPRGGQGREQFRQALRLHGFDEVMIETRFESLLHIRLVAIAGDGDQDGAELRPLPERA